MSGPFSSWSDHALDQAQHRGDIEADAVLTELLMPWSATPTADEVDANMRLIHETFGALRALSVNGDFDSAALNQQVRNPRVRAAISRLTNTCASLPEWAEPQRIARAEALFKDSGVLACVLLFCSSLPEVYCAPDISAALHTTGNLEKTTDQRIRTTAVMILSVLMKGGLLSSFGGGRPHVLKARFGHAIVRNLLLRGAPQAPAAQPTPAFEPERPPRGMFELMLAHGWDAASAGVPCNQEELAYTLLTFSYVYLRSLRRIGLQLPHQDEEAYLHFWNVVGHVLGIDAEMMAHSMPEAEFLFGKLQQRAEKRASAFSLDARPLLGAALMNTIEKSISVAALRPLVSVITRFLTSVDTAKSLGLNSRITVASRAVFAVGLVASRALEAIVRLVRPAFSIARFVVRVVGYQLLNTVLTDTEKPVELTPHLREQMNSVLESWSRDTQAPSWLNALEDRLTTKGSWSFDRAADGLDLSAAHGHPVAHLAGDPDSPAVAS